MASASDAHTPQSQKAAFSPSERKGAGLVLTLCPSWLLWKGPCFYGPLEFIRKCCSFSRVPIPAPGFNGASTALHCLFNKDPYHLHSYLLHFPHHKLSWVGACRVGVHWQKIAKNKEHWIGREEQAQRHIAVVGNEGETLFPWTHTELHLHHSGKATTLLQVMCVCACVCACVCLELDFSSRTFGWHHCASVSMGQKCEMSL